MAVCSAHTTAGVPTPHDDYSEIVLNGDIRIRQRMEASRHGMLQLDSLRTKHQKLMEQLRNEYPDYLIAPKFQCREKKSPLHAAAIFNTVAAILSPIEQKFEDPSRCESPISSCVSHRSSVSIDSGYTSISSEHQLNLNSHHPPMSYRTYRKLTNHNTRLNSMSDQSDAPNEMPSPTNSVSEQQIVATAIESTTAVKPSNRLTKNWQRPKSMYDKASDPDISNEQHCASITNSTTNQIENLYTPIKPRSHAGKLMDSISFSQLTPPPMHRKFGNQIKNNETKIKPIPPARKFINKTIPTNHTPHTMPIRAVAPPRKPVQTHPTQNGGSLHSQSHVQQIKETLAKHAQQAATQTTPQICRRPLRTAQKPQPQFATITPQPSVFHASKIYVDRSTSTSNESSPETRRGPRRVFSRQKAIVKMGSCDENASYTSSDYASVQNEDIHMAQPAVVLSRQQSTCYSSENSPVESRKLFVASPPNNSTLFTIYAKPFAERKEANGKPNGISRLRKEKVWHESEQL